MSDFVNDFREMWVYSYIDLGVTQYNQIPAEALPGYMAEYADRFRRSPQMQEMTWGAVKEIWREGLRRLSADFKKRGLRPMDREFRYEDLIWIFRTHVAQQQEQPEEAPREEVVPISERSEEEIITGVYPGVIKTYESWGYIPTNYPAGIGKLYVSLWNRLDEKTQEAVKSESRRAWLRALSEYRPVPDSISSGTDAEILEWIEGVRERYMKATGTVTRLPFRDIDYHPNRYKFEAILKAYRKMEKAGTGTKKA